MKSWKDFREFIAHANLHCEWLVLRNFEYLPDDFFENDKDVDILCLDLEHFVTTMGLIKRSWGVAAYKGIIGGIEVDFDLRFLGDGYYDKLWQAQMLKNKEFTADGVPRMSNEDYFYSLVWHAKLQKKVVKDVYVPRLYSLACELGIEGYQLESVFDDQYVAKLLSEFCIRNYYRYEKPFDLAVPLNSNVYSQLNKRVTGDAYRLKQPLKRKLISFVPRWLLRCIPGSMKQNFKRLIKL